MNLINKWIYVCEEDNCEEDKLNYYVNKVNPETVRFEDGEWQSDDPDSWWYTIDPKTGKLDINTLADLNIKCERDVHASMLDLSGVPLPDVGEMLIVTQSLAQSINYFILE